MTGHEKIIDKIRKLLALSKSDNEHEAALAAARAMELLSKHNLNLNEIDLQDPGVKAGKASSKTYARPQLWMAHLVNAVAAAFDCSSYHNRWSHETTFVGVGADPDVAAFTFSYLFHTIKKLATKHVNQKRYNRLR
ncbi:MAG: DUF2786 domain-containing protein, partial [Desulfuromonadales bacterium]|nr:DUF2786 domain-containing protein [Desulfuromonadales bacterium]